MKRLYLLRHAKSGRDDPRLDDFDRPLTDRGRQAAARMGREMCRRGLAPELVLCSAALRAVATWDRMCVELGCKPHVETFHALYMAGRATIMECLRQIEPVVESVLVIGHNPGLQQFALRLASPDSDGIAAARLGGKFPTCALAVFEVATDRWPDLNWGEARLTTFVAPADLD